jgi:hypothetical protein
MRQKGGVDHPELWVNQCALFNPTVVGLMVLETEVRHVITEAQNEVIVAVMRRTK